MSPHGSHKVADCHAERREASLMSGAETLHYVQGDSRLATPPRFAQVVNGLCENRGWATG